MIFDIKSPMHKRSMKTYMSPVSTIPEKSLSLKNNDISLIILLFSFKHPQILLVAYANNTDSTHAIILE